MSEIRATNVGPLKACKMSIRTRMNNSPSRIQLNLKKTRKIINSSKPSKNQNAHELQMNSRIPQTLLDASSDLLKLEIAENVMIKEKTSNEFENNLQNYEDREEINNINKNQNDNFIKAEREEKQVQILKEKPINFD
ncbi:hypothetical protein HCN44_009826 [Aphidius gifuensis]|uniref:Uncharacterized protein n=1 Tax=Aphidius gifuensis TaxID=684658 RepID=A0A834Y012_APHGI|nr:hypothetical protein HCN44_009826 [Aphidius gifuensis]